MKLKYKLCVALFAWVSAFHVAAAPQTHAEVSNVTTELNDIQIRLKAQQSADKGDWKTVYTLLLPLAQRGDSQAQVNLGILFSSGRGVEKNLEKAYWWFNESAEQGNAKAVTYIGLMYLEGIGVKQDTKHAIRILEKAGRVDYPRAMLALGNAYYMEKNLQKSFLWFERAAMKGVSEAQFKLGMMYEKGEGTHKDEEQAVYWYQTSLKANDDIAEFAKERLSALGRLR